MSLLVFPVLAGLVGCFTEGPTFNGIAAVTVKQYTSDGTVSVRLSTTQQQKSANCLYHTTEVDESETEDTLLTDVYLIDVEDHAGIRSFELFTRSNLKGNKGKYYKNTCIYDIIGGAQRESREVNSGDE